MSSIRALSGPFPDTHVTGQLMFSPSRRGCRSAARRWLLSHQAGRTSRGLNNDTSIGLTKRPRPDVRQLLTKKEISATFVGKTASAIAGRALSWGPARGKPNKSREPVLPASNCLPTASDSYDAGLKLTSATSSRSPRATTSTMNRRQPVNFRLTNLGPLHAIRAINSTSSPTPAQRCHRQHSTNSPHPGPLPGPTIPLFCPQTRLTTPLGHRHTADQQVVNQ